MTSARYRASAETNTTATRGENSRRLLIAPSNSLTPLPVTCLSQTFFHVRLCRLHHSYTRWVYHGFGDEGTQWACRRWLRPTRTTSTAAGQTRRVARRSSARTPPP